MRDFDKHGASEAYRKAAERRARRAKFWDDVVLYAVEVVATICIVILISTLVIFI